MKYDIYIINHIIAINHERRLKIPWIKNDQMTQDRAHDYLNPFKNKKLLTNLSKKYFVFTVSVI